MQHASTSTSEILFNRRGPLGIVTLHRPQALNAQNLDMVRAFATQLQDWEADPAITRLLIHGAGDKAFCAGGDVRALWAAPAERRMDFFTAEYSLCAALRATRLETVAYMDGITMGGGVGLSIHADHRLATAKTVWAMPETAIGFYPDICATHFLSRLTVHCTPAPGLGRALALTGLRLEGADCAGSVADRYVGSGQDDALIAGLVDAATVTGALASFDLPTPASTIPALAADLNALAAAPLPQFLDALVGLGLLSPDYTRNLCAFSLAVTDEGLRRGAVASYDATLALDETVVRRFLAGDTFREGVRARLVDRDQTPSWAGQRLADVDPADVAAVFA